MDDSDEYEFDDFVLDEQTIAALDQAERKYQALKKPPSPPVEPVNKRHKTEVGWRPGPGTKLNYVANDDFDDLPEISVRGDGSYGIRNITTKPNPVVASISARHPAVARPVNIGRASSTSSSSSVALENRRAATPRGHVNNGPKKAAHNPTPAEVNSNIQTRKPLDPYHLEGQLQQLRNKLEEMREENAKTQSALKEAVERRLVKEGEVSILRKTMEKNAQNHAAQIAQLKAEKEKLDASQLQIQKDLKEEMERLRTELTFTQHDLEVSARKIPASVRGKKLLREIPATPLAASFSRRAWNIDVATSRSRNALEETPLRPMRPPPPFFKASPTKDNRRSPDKKKISLPGFQNAFETSTPLRSPSKRQKGKEKTEPMFGVETNDNPFALSTMPPPPSELMKPPQTMQITIPTNIPVHNNSPLVDEDVEMVTQESDEDAIVDEEPFDPINWKAELSRVMLTHSHPSLNEITLHLILSSSNTVEDHKSYSLACANILAVLASLTDDLEVSLRIICTNVMSVLEALCQPHQLIPVFASFDLLTTLVLSIPTFRKALLSSCLSPDEGHSSLIIIIQKVLLTQLNPEQANSVNWKELADSLMSLVESICFSPSPPTITQLRFFSHNRDVIASLIQFSQPIWFLERSSRLLALLASHNELWDSLLGPSTNDGLKNPFIDRLCSHLIDMHKPPTEVYKLNILIFFGQISIADPQAHVSLVTCRTLIPSLILYISHLTTPLWEDDDLLVSSKEALSSLIRLINQTMFLLHHLIFGTDPCVSLRSKIQQAPTRPYSTVLNVFTVAFGRLSYCEAPSWVDTESRKELESMAEIARDILELVIDGPEGDSIWAAFQSEQDEDTVDMEELEARFMGDDT